jgi:Protein of unknown function (DUF3604)
MGRVPSNFAGKIDKLTIEIDRPRVAPADIQKLKESRSRCSKKDGGFMKTRIAVTVASALLLLSTGAMISCNKSEGPKSAQSTAQLSNAEQKPQPNPDRNAYFGEEHIHTSWSVDAWVIGNRLTGPDDALKYAQGQTIKHPMGYDIKIDTPMDFMGVTDHSEYVGVTKEANTPRGRVRLSPATDGTWSLSIR